MRDIRRRSHNSKSNLDNLEIKKRRNIEQPLPSRDSLSDKTERFEKGEYDDISYTRDGKPIMKASNHFDLNNGPQRRKKNDFDVLKRSEFFNKKRPEFDEEDVQVYRKARNKKKRTGRKILYILIILIILTFVALTFVFDKSNIVISPKYRDVSISDTLLVFNDDTLIDVASSSLSKTVLKSEPKEVNQRSSGEIMIYNNYSEAPQVLIKSTRFQTEDGKVFRIGDSVTVPGKVGSTPGHITAKVSADTYGADYNIGPSDFNIPGFKGTARYQGFYAKSTSAMTGGMSGVVQIVAQNDIASARADLEPQLDKNLKVIYDEFAHDGYYTLYGVPIVKLLDNANDLSTSTDNSYTLSGLATVLSVKKEVLAKLIAEKTLGTDYDSSNSFKLESIDNLVFTLSEDTDPTSNLIKVTVSGRVRLIWTFNETELRTKLIGQKTSAFDSLLNAYKYAIVDAHSENRPPWVKNFPGSLSKIKIVEVIK